jgi:hypothetical protein
MPPRNPLFSWCARALAVLIAVALVGCGGNDDDDARRNDNSQSAAQKVEVPGADVELRLTSVDVQSVGPGVTLDDDTKAAVMKQARTYVEEAIVRPLLQGGKSKRYAKLFAPPVTAAATGADRAALTDEEVGKVGGDVTAPAAKVAMHALAGPDGSVQFIATNFSLNLRSTLGGKPLSIKRRTELTFEQAPNGGWLVTAYRILATRGTGRAGGKTSAATSSTTGKP